MKKLLKILLLFSLSAALCLALAACSGQETEEEEEAAEEEYHYAAEDIAVGTFLGSFASTDLDGDPVTDAIFGEKDVTVLNIWGTYCGPCQAEMPDLARLDEAMPDNVQVIGVVIDVPVGDTEMIDLAKEICGDTGVTYTNILMNDSVAAMLSSIEAIPTTFILDKEGKTVCTPIVGADVDRYRDEVLKYLEKIE